MNKWGPRHGTRCFRLIQTRMKWRRSWTKRSLWRGREWKREREREREM
jgi:hypothetical protein